MLNNILETEPCYRKYLFYEPCTVLFLKWRPRPHLWKCLHFDKFRPSVHTNMLSFSIENASVWKMHLRSGAKRIHICIVWVWTVENSQKCIKMKSMTKKYHRHVCWSCSMVIEFNLCHNAQLYHFQTLKCGQSKSMIKTVVWMRIDRCVFNDNKNAYFWKCTSVDSPRPPGGVL